MTTRLNPKNGLPAAQGLYHPAHEHDACGIGFVASIQERKVTTSFAKESRFF